MYKVVYTKTAAKDVPKLKSAHLDEKAKALIEITVSLGSQEITFWGDDLKINSFTREGAVVQGNITSMEFSS